jgi:prepilin-type N-terminal cleavage/methylation domain-containing protein
VRRAFTLIELLVVVAIIAVLIAILLPALGHAREAGRSTVCLSNLRSLGMICRQYADEFKGRSPALGQPYGSFPNWALVVQTYAGVPGDTPGELYREKSVLICPTINAHYAFRMTRTYAINVTGHAGLPGDPDNYDDAARSAHIRMDSIDLPSARPLLVDAAVADFPSNAPPPTRSASVLDFRDPVHVAARLGVFHSRETRFNAALCDLSARVFPAVPSGWERPLP